MKNPISIVVGKLKPVGGTVVKKTKNAADVEALNALRKEIADCNLVLKECPDDAFYKSCLDDAKKKHNLLAARVKQEADKYPVMVRRYVDKNGAQYVETIQKGNPAIGTGTPIRKLEKLEEEFLPDGRKILRRTTHDKSDRLLMGQGNQDGIIEVVEELQTKEGVTVGRKTTSQQASGYGTKLVKREGSVDGQELSRYNTKTTYTTYDVETGRRYDKEIFNAGGSVGEGTPYRYQCDEKGKLIIKEGAINPNW